MDLGLEGTCGAPAAVSCAGEANASIQMVARTPFRAQSIDAHQYNACAITEDSELRCWYEDTFGEVSNTPTTGSWTEVALGANMHCAIDDLGEIECWGSIATPPQGTGFHSLSLGGLYACALTASNGIQCWGIGSDRSIATPRRATILFNSALEPMATPVASNKTAASRAGR